MEDWREATGRTRNFSAAVVFKEDVQVQKAIGFIACVSVMAVSLYLFSGADPSRILSAQTESTDVDSYGSVARRFMNDARQLAKQGNVREARRLAETAASLSSQWKEGEQTPEQFLAELDGKANRQTPNPFSLETDTEWPALDRADLEVAEDGQPFGAVVGDMELAEPVPQGAGVEILNRRKAKQLMKEARAALKNGDIATARARAMQARAFKVSWGLWDELPEHLLSEIDQADGTTTFLANGDNNTAASARPQNAEEVYQQAKAFLVQARAAMDAGKLKQAEELVQQADQLNATYTLWEDSPAYVKRDLQRLTQTGAAPAMVFEDRPKQYSNDELTARALLTEARQALQQGQYGLAQQKAEEAEKLNVTYSLMDERPELILSAVEQARNGQSHAAGAAATDIADRGVDMTPEPTFPQSAFEADSGVVRVSSTPADLQLPVIQSGGETEQQRAQQVASARDVTIVAAAQAESSADAQLPTPSDMDPMAATDPLEQTANEVNVRFSRLRTEVLNSMFRADKLKEKNPDEAMAVLERTMESVKSADLPEESAKVLVGHVERAQKNIRTYMEQRAPLIALEARNQNVKEQIERQVENQIRIEQEFADLTQQFNELIKQRRFAEAELVAKKAKDVNPDLPQAEIMIQKAKLQRQIAFIEDVKTKKADNALEMLNGVEESFASPVGDYVLPDAKSWSDLSSRRAKYGHPSARTRSESERKIEKSLSETVSLHFHNVPLTEIIRHIATTHGINIAMDKRAIETEGLMLDQPLSIDVDGIPLRSALSLVLEQADGLVYDIQYDVLKITNRLAQDSTYKLEVYNVADLVVPMNLNAKLDPFENLSNASNSAYAGGGLFQVDDDLTVGISGNGMPRGGGSGRDNMNGADFSGLVDLITTTVEPGTWDSDGGAGRLQGNENTLSLVIRQTPAVHEQIVELLGQLRKLQDLQVTVEVRFISVTDRFFERIGVDFDFNVQDNLGDPPGVPAFGSRQLNFPGGGGGGQAGTAGGGTAGSGGDLRGGGGTAGGGQAGQAGQAGQQGQQGGALGLFDSIQRVNSPRDDFNGQTVGLQSPDSFTEDYDIQFRQGSFELGVPDFGNFNPDAGIQVGMAILSDIEAFFFIQAAQADERANILVCSEGHVVQRPAGNHLRIRCTRPFVTALIPVVGTGAVGFQPVTTVIPGRYSTLTGARGYLRRPTLCPAVAGSNSSRTLSTSSPSRSPAAVPVVERSWRRWRCWRWLRRRWCGWRLRWRRRWWRLRRRPVWRWWHWRRWWRLRRRWRRRRWCWRWWRIWRRWPAGPAGPGRCRWWNTDRSAAGTGIRLLYLQLSACLTVVRFCWVASSDFAKAATWPVCRF